MEKNRWYFYKKDITSEYVEMILVLRSPNFIATKGKFCTYIELDTFGDSWSVESDNDTQEWGVVNSIEDIPI